MTVPRPRDDTPAARVEPVAPVLGSDDYDGRLTRCPLCAAEALRPHDSDHRGHIIDLCGGCGIMLMNPQYSDAYLGRYYGSYISVDNQGDGSFRGSLSVRRTGKTRSLTLLLEQVKTVDGRPPRVLMVGCGDGIELEIARDLGFEPEGYDIDPETTAEVAARRGAPVHSGPFDQLSLPNGHFDAVFMDQVIEHLKDPVPYLSTCHRLLRTGGVLYLGMPNIGSIANRLKTLQDRLRLKPHRRGSHYASKHHIFYYRPDVLKRALKRHGFEVYFVRGSLKPQRRFLSTVLGSDLWRRWFPNVDSGFLALCRRTD